ncbi:hypothetical protein JYK14_05615 [Siccirubricoccus sp. KC 17139]|uniref:Uncharacterized protein n=1 Tax=Siccirubricoccus soli TaxID=2899147 RepID=A0ABT1D163_9PROT|nr:hypothetical protein [Siccirubricoccus soli]MCO6415655.1 hypothetical protein [Siccirubricoccus soli]MCP2681787.1 hypothetical protein [Siccirubricoccus soli]
MPRLRRVGLKTYRQHRLEMLDDGHEGWVVAIHAPDDGGQVTLRNHVPSGLVQLLEEARQQVDRRLDPRPLDAVAPGTSSPRP